MDTTMDIATVTIMDTDTDTDMTMVTVTVTVIATAMDITLIWRVSGDGNVVFLRNINGESNIFSSGVFLHILADTLGSVGVIISTILIKWFGWTGFDPIASIFIAVLIFLSVIPLIKNSAAVLLLQVDDHTAGTVEAAVEDLKTIQGVRSTSQPRFWPNEPGSLIGTIHIQVSEEADMQEIRQLAIELLMSKIEGLKELCVQVEREGALERAEMEAAKAAGGFAGGFTGGMNAGFFNPINNFGPRRVATPNPDPVPNTISAPPHAGRQTPVISFVQAMKGPAKNDKTL